jgi:SAM-dependent methyltransferase
MIDQQIVKPQLVSKDAYAKCRLCGNLVGIWEIHYPETIFRSGDFEAPPWFAHSKYYCPACHFLWTDVFKEMDLVEYGKKYVENNYDHQRRPTESRMAYAPHLIAKLLSLTGGSRFLDYGCGYNYTYIYELRSRGLDLWGCDISAAVNYSRYILKLPFENFPDAFFDGIFSMDVMEHLSDFENDFKNMVRILRPGGYMLHNTISLDQFWKEKDSPPEDPMVWAPWHCSVFSTQSAGIIAEKLGLFFEGAISTKSDTELAFLFRKPGPSLKEKFNILGKAIRRWKLVKYRVYFYNSYTGAKTVAVPKTGL